MSIYIQGVGVVDENADLATLFREDANGAFGLYAGQLIDEAQKEPALRKQIPEVVRNGLKSASRSERESALAGAYLYRGNLNIVIELQSLAIDHPEEANSAYFVAVLARQTPSGEVDRLIQLMLSRQLNIEVLSSLLATIAERAPDLAIQKFWEWFTQKDDALACAALKALREDRFAEVVDNVRSQHPEARRRFVTIAYEAMRANLFPESYERWMRLASEFQVPTPPMDPPVETEALRQFRSRIPELMAQDAAEAPAMTIVGPHEVVLTPEVWVDMIRTPAGPPAVLASLLISRNIKIYASDAMLNAIQSQLFALGWDAGRTHDGLSRVKDMVEIRPEPTAIEIARAIGTPVVFASPQPNVGRGSAILVQQRKIMAISATTL
jgi:hypothetical protein